MAIPDVGNAAGLPESYAEIPAIERLRHLPLLDADLVRRRAEAIAEVF